MTLISGMVLEKKKKSVKSTMLVICAEVWQPLSIFKNLFGTTSFVENLDYDFHIKILMLFLVCRKLMWSSLLI